MMDPGKFAYVWEYKVDASHREEFLAAYRPGGAWTTLFSTRISAVPPLSGLRSSRLPTEATFSTQ